MGTIKMLTYRVDNLPQDAAGRRKLFEFAKAMGVDTLVTAAKIEPSSIAALADEFGVNVAVLSQEARPVELMKTLQSASKRVGIGIDTGVWARRRRVAPRRSGDRQGPAACI